MQYLKNVLLVLLLIFFFVPGARTQSKALINGTIIITLTSNDTIWIAADSRTSSLTNKGYTANKEGMCKIYSTNNMVYAMAGHVRYVDNSFNFLEIMRKCIKDESDFDKSMEQFQQRSKSEITSILTRFSKKSINTLIKTNNGSFLSVVAISFVGGEKKMIEIRFSVDKNRQVTSKVTDEIGVGSLRFLGHAANASAHIRNNKLFFGNGKNIPDRLIDLIKLEAQNSTTTVGMPADVISIYNNGHKRVISSGLCY